jgi:hypothetical protein
MKYLILLSMAFALTTEAAQQRSYHAIKQFKLANPCPANGRYKGSCPGYVIDHVKALACGGLDTPKNMQWQTVEDAKAKDKWERVGCNVH